MFIFFIFIILHYYVLIIIKILFTFNVDNKFIEELYKGIIDGSYGAEVIGGDITGADKISISITAIGKTQNRRISSRSNAKNGYIIISNGEFGKSINGLKELQEGKKESEFIRAHLMPELELSFSELIATQIQEDYAMMDTSDGLADALFQIAKASNVKIVTPKIDGIFGAEDYKLVAAVPKDFLKKLNNYKIIGLVEDFDGSYLKIDDKNYKNYDELNLFNHFN